MPLWPHLNRSHPSLKQLISIVADTVLTTNDWLSIKDTDGPAWNYSRKSLQHQRWMLMQENFWNPKTCTTQPITLWGAKQLQNNNIHLHRSILHLIRKKNTGDRHSNMACPSHLEVGRRPKVPDHKLPTFQKVATVCEERDAPDIRIGNAKGSRFPTSKYLKRVFKMPCCGH